eukprot:2557626-Prymnesium_polylepis.1
MVYGRPASPVLICPGVSLEQQPPKITKKSHGGQLGRRPNPRVRLVPASIRRPRDPWSRGFCRVACIHAAGWCSEASHL